MSSRVPRNTGSRVNGLAAISTTTCQRQADVEVGDCAAAP